MTLPIENLDDKTFEELVKEAVSRIHIYTPEGTDYKWTDHNIHDPGITLIELFAWLAEMQIYRLNRITDRSYRKFLKLMGIPKLKSARAAEVDVTFSPCNQNPTSVPKGTKVAASDPISGEDIIFETEDDLKVVDAKLLTIRSKPHSPPLLFSMDASESLKEDLNKGIISEELKEGFKKGDIPLSEKKENLIIMSIPKKKEEWMMIDREYHNHYEIIKKDGKLNISPWFIDNTEANKNPHVYYHAFSDKPERGDQLWLGFKNSLTGKEITLAFYLYEEDLPKAGKFDEGKPDIYPSATLIWEYYISRDKSGKEKWERLEIKDDGTKHLTVSGKIRLFKIEKEIKTLGGFFWIRCRVKEAGYEIPPRINMIRLNTVSAVQCRSEQCTISSNGLSDFYFDLKHTPVIDKTLKVVEEEWNEVEDFDASKPGDRQYFMDLATGRVTFGDGIHGKVPPKGENNISVSYHSGGGVYGNVGPHAIDRVLGKLAEEVTVDNVNAASGGEEAETLEEAIQRARKDMKTVYRAVTFEDYEHLAKNTPGLRVARAKALPQYHPSQNSEIPGIVTVVVVPHSPYAKPEPSAGFLKTVYRHLDKHRLVTTELFVMSPEYVEVSVEASVVIKPKSHPSRVKGEVEKELRNFLNPITGGMANKGWPFGRSVYISEIYKIIDGVEGVDYVTSLKLKREGKDKPGDILISPHSLVFHSKDTKITIEKGASHE